MAKRAREFITPAMWRDIIMVTLEGAGLSRPLACDVAYAAAKTLPDHLRSQQNQRALTLAIAEQIAVHRAARDARQADMDATIRFVARATARAHLRVIEGGAP